MEHKKNNKNKEITQEVIERQRDILNVLICFVLIFLISAVVGLFINIYFSLIAFILFIITLIYSINLYQKLTKNSEDYINRNLINVGFNEEKSIMIKETLDSIQKFKVDYTNKKWTITDNVKILNIYKFADIINYEVFENGLSKVKGTAGKALVGGWLFGIGGAIVGSSMSKGVDEYCDNLELRIRINDSSSNEIILNFIKNEKINKSSDSYLKAKNNLKSICSILEFMINAKTLEQSMSGLQNESKVEKTNKEQLLELKEMLDDGLITQEEYDQKKKQILEL